MSVPIHHEPDTLRGWSAEPCCFCHESTRFWTSLSDRSPAAQVACCPFCADIFDPDVVPSKREWFDHHVRG